MKSFIVIFKRLDASPKSDFLTTIKAEDFDDAKRRLNEMMINLQFIIYNATVEGEYQDNFIDATTDDLIAAGDYEANIRNLDYLFLWEQRDWLDEDEKEKLKNELLKYEEYEKLAIL